MSARFKLKNRDNWKCQGLDEVLPQNVKNQLPEKLFYYSEDDVLGLGIDGAESAPVYIDIDHGLNDHISYFAKKSRKSELFYKSLKLDAGSLIHDLTGGLLGDTLMMLAWGYQVKCYEGNPVLAPLIENALKRAEHPLVKNLEFIPEYFQWGETVGQTYFYDPFFYKQKDKSKSGKGMEVLKILDQQPYVLEKPKTLYKRIIVKRHVKAADLWPNPVVSFKGKSIRYDCY